MSVELHASVTEALQALHAQALALVPDGLLRDRARVHLDAAAALVAEEEEANGRAWLQLTQDLEAELDAVRDERKECVVSPEQKPSALGIGLPKPSEGVSDLDWGSQGKRAAERPDLEAIEAGAKEAASAGRWSSADFAFLGAARSDVPTLIAYARSLEAELHAWQEHHQGTHEALAEVTAEKERLERRLAEVTRTAEEG